MKYSLLCVVLAGLGFQTVPTCIHAFDITPGKWQFEYEGRASLSAPAAKAHRYSVCHRLELGPHRLNRQERPLSAPGYQAGQDLIQRDRDLWSRRGKPAHDRQYELYLDRHKPDRAHGLHRTGLRHGNANQRNTARRVRLAQAGPPLDHHKRGVLREREGKQHGYRSACKHPRSRLSGERGCFRLPVGPTPGTRRPEAAVQRTGPAPRGRQTRRGRLENRPVARHKDSA